MLITLFTDASHCPQSRLGTYAVWARSEGQTVRRAGLLRGLVDDSTAAETMALLNGVHVVVSEFHPGPGARIIAQTDCLGTIRALTNMNRSRQTRLRYAPMRGLLKELLGRFTATIEFRHVGGHKGAVTPRNAVNTWCDQECRRLLRAARTQAPPGE